MDGSNGRDGRANAQSSKGFDDDLIASYRLNVELALPEPDDALAYVSALLQSIVRDGPKLTSTFFYADSRSASLQLRVETGDVAAALESFIDEHVERQNTHYDLLSMIVEPEPVEPTLEALSSSPPELSSVDEIEGGLSSGARGGPPELDEPGLV